MRFIQPFMICRRSLALAMLFLIGPLASAEDNASLTLHPNNPHYFRWQGEPTFLITSGEHYGALLNLDFNYRTYFEALAEDGLNHTRTFSGTYRETESSFGITDNPLAPKPNRYACPWARSDTPGYYDAGNKFDLNRFDPAYFDRLKDFMQAAEESGIVVEYTLFCPLYRDELWDASPMNARNNISGVGDCVRTEALTLKHADLLAVQLVFTRKVVQELNEFDNLYFEICNEPYFGGVTMEWQNAIVDAIVETERDLPNKHLISMNIANGRAKVENPHPSVSIFNFHYCVPPDVVQMNWNLQGVIGENETGFRGSDDLLYRTEAWDFLLAGGGLYNNLDYSFTPPHPDGTFSGYSSPGGGSPALREQLGILKRFLESYDFLNMATNNEVILSVDPELTAYTLVEPGEQYAVYLHAPLPNKPRRISDHVMEHVNANLRLELPAGEYEIEWLDVKSGRIAHRARVDHSGGECPLQSPTFTNDIALRILKD